MEGALWKWTNYWNGWQLRWFVLDNGVLAYYKSQDDVNSGCKGSVKVSTCEIDVPANDVTRLTVSIPGEQHMYLRAPSSQERQQWVVALGSAKACLSTRPKGEGEGVDSLKSKRSELRLYCDLLMQQAHQVKTSVQSNPPDIEKLSEATGLLSLTCDTFTQTVDEIVKLADASFMYEQPHQHATDVGLSRGSAGKVRPAPAVSPSVPSMKRSSSYEISERKT